MNEHERLRVDLGAYALGQLDEGAAARLEQHLDGCSACTAELGEITPVAAGLADLRRRGGPPASEPPPGLADRVASAVDRAARLERRTSWARTVAVAGVAAALALVVAFGVRGLGEDPAPTTPAVPTEAVAIGGVAPGVQASAALVSHTWGVEVKLRASGLEAGDRYRVDVLGTGGRRYPAGEFVGTGSRTMDCNLNSSVLRDRAAGFEVLDRRGSVVVASSFG